MKYVVQDILKFVFDCIFNVWTFLILLGGLIIAAGVGSAANEAKIQEQTRILTEACYSQGLVLVTTDAGQRCADPRSLVKVK